MFGLWSSHQPSGRKHLKWWHMAIFKENRGCFVLTGSLWQGCVAVGRPQRIKKGFSGLQFSWEHRLCLDWKPQSGNARSRTDTPWTSASLGFFRWAFCSAIADRIEIKVCDSPQPQTKDRVWSYLPSHKYSYSVVNPLWTLTLAKY